MAPCQGFGIPQWPPVKRSVSHSDPLSKGRYPTVVPCQRVGIPQWLITTPDLPPVTSLASSSMSPHHLIYVLSTLSFVILRRRLPSEKSSSSHSAMICAANKLIFVRVGVRSEKNGCYGPRVSFFFSNILSYQSSPPYIQKHMILLNILPSCILFICTKAPRTLVQGSQVSRSAMFFVNQLTRGVISPIYVYITMQ